MAFIDFGKAIGNAVGNAVKTYANEASQEQKQKTAYQINTEKITPKKEEPMTSRKALATINELAKVDQKAATNLYDRFKNLQQDQTSMYYNPYANPTNRAVEALARYGIDTSVIDDKFFADNDYLKQYLIYNGTTNTPSSPGKKASTLQKAAYEYYQIWKAEDATKKAETQWAALQQELATKALLPNRNYSDEEIIAGIDWSKYGELKKMYSQDASFARPEYNRAIGYSDENLYAVLWAARNPDFKGTLDQALANSYLGTGNTYHPNENMRAKLTKGGPDFDIYTVGSTMEDMQIYFGMSGFDQKWLDDNRWMLDSQDETQKNNYIKVDKAFKTTQEAKEERNKLYSKLDEWLIGATNADNVMKKVDSLLASGDYNTLLKMDKSLGDGYGILDTTSAVDYSRKDVEKMVKRVCGANAAKGTAHDFINKIVGGINKFAQDENVRSVGLQTQAEQAAEVDAKKDQTLREANDTIEDQMTPAERALATQAPSVAWPTTKDMFRVMRDAPNAATGRLLMNRSVNAQQEYTQATFDNLGTVLDYEDKMEQYNILQQQRETLDASVGDLSYAGTELPDQAELNFKINGLDSTLYLERDIETGKYYAPDLEAIENTAFYDPYGGVEAYRSEAKKQVDAFNEQADRIRRGNEQKANITPEEQQKAEQDAQSLREITATLDLLGQDLKDGKAAYDAAKTNYEQAEAKWNQTQALVFNAGIETDGGLELNTMMRYVTDNFRTKPTGEKTTYNVANMMDQLMFDETAKTGAAREEVGMIVAGQKYAINAEIQDIDNVMNYFGDRLPDRYRQAMEETKNDLQRDAKTYDYFTLSLNKDFEEGVKKGREMDAPLLAPNESIAAHQWYWGDMTQEERDRYYYLLHRDGEAAAKEYYEFLADPQTGMLAKRHMEGWQNAIHENIGEDWALLNAISVLTAPVDAVMSGLGLLYSAVTGNELEKESPLMFFNQFAQTVNGDTSQMIKDRLGENTFLGKLAGGAYEIVYNRGRSMMMSSMFPFLGEYGEFAGAVPMALGAMASTVADAKANGAEDWQAWLLGGITFFCEAGTEMINLRDMKEAVDIAKDPLSTFKDFVVNWLTKAGPSETLGESLNDIAEKAANYFIMRDKSDYEKRVWNYMVTQNVSRERAEELAFGDDVKDVLHTALVSYFTPGADVLSYAGVRAKLNWAYHDIAKGKGTTVHELFEQMRSSSQQNSEREPGAINYNALEQRYGEAARQAREAAANGGTTEQAAQGASGQEAGPAVPMPKGAELAEQENEYITEMEILETAKDGPNGTESAAVAAVLDPGNTQENTDRANAASVRANEVFRGGTSEIQDLFAGGLVSGQNINTLKMGIIYASLGGENSACRQTVMSEAYQQAAPDQRAAMLTQAVMLDAANQGVMEAVSKAVYEDMIARETERLMAEGAMEGAKQAQDAADEARTEAKDADEQLGQKQDEMAAAQDQVRAANEAVQRNPGEGENAVKAAVSKVVNTAAVVNEYEQKADAAHDKQEKAEMAAQQAKQDALTDTRQQAKANVDKVMEQRRQEQAAMEAQNRIDAEIRARTEAAARENRNFARLNAEDFVKNNFPNLSKEAREYVIGRVVDIQAEMSNNVDSILARRDFAKAFAKKFGLEWKSVDTSKGGKYSPAFNARVNRETGVLEVDKSATQSDIMYAILTHEITHLAEQSRTYHELADFALQLRYGDGVTYKGILDLMRSGDVSSRLAQDILEMRERYVSELSKNKDIDISKIDNEYALQEVVADSVGYLIAGDQEALNRLVAEKPSLARRILESIKSFLRKAVGLEDETLSQAQQLVDTLEAALNDESTRDETKYNLGRINDPNYYLEYGDYKRFLSVLAKGEKVLPRKGGGFLVDIGGTMVYANNDETIEAVLDVSDQPTQTASDMKDRAMELAEKGEMSFEDQRETLEGMVEQGGPAFRPVGYGETTEGDDWGGETQSSEFDSGRDRTEVPSSERTDAAVADWYRRANKRGARRPIPRNTSLLNNKERYSISSGNTIAKDQQGNALATELPGGTVAIDDGFKYSLSSFTGHERDRVRQALYNAKNEDGTPRFTKQEVDKYLYDAMGLAAKIAQDRKRLDFEASDNQVFLKPNNDYHFTLDASTLCAKRLLYQGTFDYVQHALPDEVFTPEDLIDLVNIMNDMGFETPCGICYVESRRRWLDTYANEFLGNIQKNEDGFIDKFVDKRFKKASEEEKAALRERLAGAMPSIDDLTTSDGLEKLRKNDPLMYKAFVAAMNAKGSANPKVVQLRTEYRGDIGKLTAKDIQNVKDIGGLRIQSFSDFETPHLLDMVQAVLDMSAVGLTSQAYTKVPNFAWVFGDTGVKINLSLIGKGTGLDADGNLVFDNVEGMNFDEAMKLRNRYSKNVGTILVGINDNHIIAAMGDPRIDFIIPFHKSGWSAEELRKMPTLNNYLDYTSSQNELMIVGDRKHRVKEIKNMGMKALDTWIVNEGDNHPGYKVIDQGDGKYTVTYDTGYETESFDSHKKRTGNKFSNFEPVGAHAYWDFRKSGEENSRIYLKKCADAGRIPKFSQFLVDNGDGTFSLPEGDDKRSTAIRTGYWKTLIDFKMYDNDGNGAPQTAVTPNINMNQAYRVLKEHKLGRQMPDRPNGTKGRFIPVESNNDVPVAIPAAEQYIELIRQKRGWPKPENPNDPMEAKPESGVIDVSTLGESQFGSRDYLNEPNTNAATAAMVNGGDAMLGNTESEYEEGPAEQQRAMAINPETGESEWRLSLPSAKPSDTPYMNAVDRGDVDTAQRMVSDEALKAGVYTNKNNRPLKLYHGTKKGFGFTVFDTARAGWGLGAIWTTSNPSVARGYSNFGYDRTASSKYIPDYGNDETIIRNARNVLNSNVERLTEAKAEEIRQGEIGKYRALADMENEAMNNSPDYTPPSEIDWDFWGVVQAFNDILNEDQLLYDEDVDFRSEYRQRYNVQHDIIGRNLIEAQDRLKEYFNSNSEAMKELKESGKGYYNLLFRGYDHGDGIIDLEYKYKPLLDLSDKFIFTETGQVVKRNDLQNTIEMEEQRGSYTLYGIPGDNPLEIDAENSFWTAIKAPIIGEGYYSTDSIVKWAKANGYTSVVIKNVMDPGVVNAYGDDYVFFNSEQLKSADPITYDDNGNVIPLSERFNTQQPDIRYSLPSNNLLDQKIRRYLEGRLTEEDMLPGEAIPEDGGLPGAPGMGPQRQFGSQTAQTSNALHDSVKKYLYNHSSYTPDSNQGQIDRAVEWVRQKANDNDPDGYYSALDEVTSDTFDYRSADGQARMLTVMSMAALKAQNGDRSALQDELRLADAYNKQGTDLGRQLQARKIFRLMTPVGRQAVLQKMVDEVNTGFANSGSNQRLALSEWIMMAASSAESEDDFQKVQRAAAKELAEQIPSNWKDKLRGWRMLSMLGNPRTHIRNIIGNALFIPAVSIKNKLGAAMELGLDQGNRTKTLAPVLSKDVREFARQDAVAMKDMLTGEAKYNETNLVERERRAFKGILQALSDFNSNALEAEDWFFLKGHYRRALGGWMQANGYTAEQMKSNPRLLEQGRNYAISEAQKATYRDFNGLAKRLNDLTRNPRTRGEKGIAFVVEAALPFKKTPANILKRGLEYSPVGIAKTLVSDGKRLKHYLDYQNGKLNALPEDAISPNQFIDNLCSGLTGTGILAVGALLASMGAASAGLDDDDDKLEKLKGNQDYAIKFNLFGQDVTFTMDWAAPMSMPFFVGVALYDQMANQKEFSIDGLLNAVSNIGEPVFNLSMLDGMNSLFKTSQYDDTNTMTQIGAKIVSNYATSYVPSLLGAIARTIDPSRRKAFVEQGQGTGVTGTLRYAWEQTENKIPGLNQTNIPYRDVWGNAEESGLAERIFENFISPGYANTYKDDPVVNSIAAVYENTGDASLIPKDADKSITVNKEKHVLNAEQWDLYQVTRGQTAYGMLNDLVGTDEFKNAAPELQAQMIKDTWSYATQVGKKAVIPEFKMDSFGDDPMRAIMNNSSGSYYKNEAVKALESGDLEAYETCVEALHQAGVEDSAIKTKIGDAYRDKYKDAYRNGDYVQMEEIENLLLSTGFSFKISDWEKAVNKEND